MTASYGSAFTSNSGFIMVDFCGRNKTPSKPRVAANGTLVARSTRTFVFVCPRIRLQGESPLGGGGKDSEFGGAPGNPAPVVTSYTKVPRPQEPQLDGNPAPPISSVGDRFGSPGS